MHQFWLRAIICQTPLSPIYIIETDVDKWKMDVFTQLQSTIFRGSLG